MKDLFLSIIIPVYKVDSDYFIECLDSCIAQKMKELEIIIIDDGSEDICSVIADKYKEKDDRIKVVHKKNEGVSAARNYGIKIANAEWITFVDADDKIDPDFCKIISEYAYADPSVQLITFSLKRLFKNNIVNAVPMYGSKNKKFDSNDIVKLRKDILTMDLTKNTLRLTFCKVIKRSVLRKNDLYFSGSLKLCEDVVFWFKVFQYVESAIYINAPLYCYRQVSGSATDKYRNNIINEQSNMLHELKKIIKATGNPEYYAEGYYLEVFYSMQRYITQYFFHDDSSFSSSEGRKKCKELFSKPPYCNMHRHINSSRLSSNHKLKFYLLKYKMYWSVNTLRDINKIISKKKVM